jgi:hypothetical protein
VGKQSFARREHNETELREKRESVAMLGEREIFESRANKNSVQS